MHLSDANRDRESDLARTNFAVMLPNIESGPQLCIETNIIDAYMLTCGVGCGSFGRGVSRYQ